jgi:enterochelin esterase-like enzyme
MPRLVSFSVLLALALALPAGADAAARAEAQAARAFQIRQLTVPSPNFRAPVPLIVFVPAGPAPRGGWPLVVMLHGYGGDEGDWSELGHADDIYQTLLSQGAVRPALIAMPGMGSTWFVDSERPNGILAERAMMRDVLPFLRDTFGISRDARDVAIIGNSMGGYGALRFGIKYPEVFGRVAALSPAIWQNVPADELSLPPERINLLIETTYFHTSPDGSVTGGIVLPNPGPHFNRAFGDPFNPRRFNELNPFTLLAKRIADGSELPALYVSVSDDDSHLLWRGAINLFETMKAGRRPISFRITGGDHTWDVWRAALPEALKFVLPLR